MTVWTAESTHPKTGHPQRDEGSVSYTGAIESAASRDTDPQSSAFAQRVWREAVRRGFPRARRRVVLGDGAAWIWNICREHFPGAIQIGWPANSTPAPRPGGRRGPRRNAPHWKAAA